MSTAASLHMLLLLSENLFISLRPKSYKVYLST